MLQALELLTHSSRTFHMYPGYFYDLRDDCGRDREFDHIAGDLFRQGMNLSCSRQRLAKVVEWCERRLDRLSAGGQVIVRYLQVLAEMPYTYEDVVSIQDVGVQPTFDVVLPDTHSFLANGALEHDGFCSARVVNAQKARHRRVHRREHVLDPDYAKKLGVDTDAPLVSQPDTGEQALEIADMLIRSGALALVVVDSVAALVPRAEIEGEMGDSHVGLQARLMSQALRKLAGALNQTKTTAIFINQLREKVGVMFGCMSSSTQGDAGRRHTGEDRQDRQSAAGGEAVTTRKRTGVPRRIVNRLIMGRSSGSSVHCGQVGGNGRAQFAATENDRIGRRAAGGQWGMHFRVTASSSLSGAGERAANAGRLWAR